VALHAFTGFATVPPADNHDDLAARLDHRVMLPPAVELAGSVFFRAVLNLVVLSVCGVSFQVYTFVLIVSFHPCLLLFNDAPSSCHLTPSWRLLPYSGRRRTAVTLKPAKKPMA
jgi:hypothetical protein